MKNILLTIEFLFLLSLANSFPANAEVAKWIPNGAPVSTYDNKLNSDKYFPAITGAGNDNAFIAWQDYRDDPSSGNIYVQKVDVSGTPVFKNSSGIITDRKATVDTSDKRFPGITKFDGSGNAFIVWEDYRNGDNNIDIYVQKIDSNGIPQWGSDKIICNYSGNQRFPQIILSNTSPVEAIVVWEDYRNSTYSQIYAQKISSNGVPLWASNGIPIDSTTKNQRSPAISPDDLTGAMIVWSDWRTISTTGLDIYGQRINSDGVGQWSSAEMVITSANEDQMFPAIAGDGLGNYIVTWEDYRTGIFTSDIYAKGINGSGSPLFGDQNICSAKDAGNNDADQRYPRVAYSTSDNGFIILWEDYRNDPANYTADIYAQKVASGGTVLWAANGAEVARIDGTTQDSVAVASLDTKGVIATWEDYRSNSVYDIYALPLPIPGSVSINSGASNTVSSTVTLNLWTSSFGVGPIEMCFSNDNSTWSSWETYSTTKASYSLAGNIGANTVYVQFRDSSTLVQNSPVYSDEITRVFMAINSGVDYTTTESVTLDLAGSNCTMQFSNDNVDWSDPYVSCASTKSWILASVDGYKTVYVHFKDNSTSNVITYSDSIILDKTAPSKDVTYPTDTATGVELNPSITITFIETNSIDSNTIAPANIYLKQGINDIGTTLSYSAATLTATLTPINKLSINTSYTVYVTGVKDLAGNTVPFSFSFTTLTDNTPPTGTITINNGDVYTNGLTVTLTLNATDNLNGVSQMRFSADGSSWKAWQSYSATASFDISSGDGLKKVYVQFQDGVGNISSLDYHDDITLDMTSPTGTISINSSATYTNSASVTLTLSCSDTTGCSQMQFSNDNAIWSTAENYAVSKAWTLANNDGTKTVYVKFKDNAGNWSSAYNDTIILDTTVPTGTISINSSATYTNSASVTLTLSCSDTNGCSQMQFSNDNATWSTAESYAVSKAWTLATGDGTKTVYVKFKDNAGNWSNAYSSTTIVLDMTSPTGTININSSATYTNSTSVTLTLSCSDSNGCSQMQFSNDNSTWSTAESYAVSKVWTLATGDGTKTVYVKFKDSAGDWSNAYSKTIILDMTAPGGGSGVAPSISLGGVPATAGQAYSYSKVVASWSSLSDVAAGLKEYLIAVGTTAGGTDILNWTSTGTVASYSGSDVSNNYFGKTLYISVKAVDQLGNESSVISSSFVFTPGDINSKGGNGDGRIDGFDLGMLGIAFGSTTGGIADINRDGKVDGDDLIILGANFGKVKP